MKNLRRKLLKRFEYKVIKNKPASVNLTPEQDEFVEEILYDLKKVYDNGIHKYFQEVLTTFYCRQFTSTYLKWKKNQTLS